ncbi:unnamed protein product [Arctogadus glacialis]
MMFCEDGSMKTVLCLVQITLQRPTSKVGMTQGFAEERLQPRPHNVPFTKGASRRAVGTGRGVKGGHDAVPGAPTQTHVPAQIPHS